jgi:hypothetical protein
VPLYAWVLMGAIIAVLGLVFLEIIGIINLFGRPGGGA